MTRLNPSSHVVSTIAAAVLVLGQSQAASILIDFGRDDGAVAVGSQDGLPTANPNSSGKYYNNYTSGFDVTNGSSVQNLLDTGGSATTIDVSVIAGNVDANGIRNGGLTNPNSSLLGDFAVATATHDYFFVNGGGTPAVGTIRISGLNPLMTYNLSMFAVRTTTSGDIRTTVYSVGANSVQLQTSGLGSGSAANPFGNDDTIVSLNGLIPDGSNQIDLNITGLVSGGNSFAYLGILQISEVPEPSAALLCGLSGLAALTVRRRRL
ncbi:MAG: PEP-CTERM sorting domain-containing protein [Verrucomicrobiota bacterium]